MDNTGMDPVSENKADETSSSAANGHHQSKQRSLSDSSDSSADYVDALKNDTDQKDATRRRPQCQPDAIHSRFLPIDSIFRCRSCDFVSHSERKIQKHYFKGCPALTTDLRYTCPLPNCGGPSFAYTYQNEIRIYHSCSRWAKFLLMSTSESTLSATSSVISSSSSSSLSTTPSTLNSSVSNSFAFINMAGLDVAGGAGDSVQSEVVSETHSNNALVNVPQADHSVTDQLQCNNPLINEPQSNNSPLKEQCSEISRM